MATSARALSQKALGEISPTLGNAAPAVSPMSSRPRPSALTTARTGVAELTIELATQRASAGRPPPATASPRLRSPPASREPAERQKAGATCYAASPRFSPAAWRPVTPAARAVSPSLPSAQSASGPPEAGRPAPRNCGCPRPSGTRLRRVPRFHEDALLLVAGRDDHPADDDASCAAGGGRRAKAGRLGRSHP